MTAFGDDLDRLAGGVERLSRHEDAGCGLDRRMGDDLLTAGDAAKNAASVIGEETFVGQLVAVLAAAQTGDRVAGADPDDPTALQAAVPPNR